MAGNGGIGGNCGNTFVAATAGVVVSAETEDNKRGAAKVAAVASADCLINLRRVRGIGVRG